MEGVTDIPESALETLAVFPLPGIVLFPGTLLPLHIFEPRYRTMVADCLAGSRCMAMANQLDEPEDLERAPRWSPIAGIGRVVHHVGLRDGRSNIVLQGLGRVRLEELSFVPPYRRARARIVGTDEGAIVPAVDRGALTATATALAAAAGVTDFEISASMGPGECADACAHQLLREGTVRQAVLEELDVAKRVRAVTGFLAEQLARRRHASSRPSGSA
jgi:ATP-dependent Lon protease